jgi:hypothetical protein
MATTPLTVDKFAAQIKAKYPQYATIPDAQLVEKVVTKYPQYKSRLGGAAPSAPSDANIRTAPSTAPAFPTRVLDQFSKDMQGAADFPASAMRDARSRYQARNPQGAVDKTLAAARSSLESVVNPTAEFAGSLTPPGIAARVASKEDPAKFMGDALTMLTPGTEEAGKATHTEFPDPTKSSGVRGSMTRGKMLMDHVDSAAKDIPVDHSAAYQWAQKAMALEKYGYQVPAPIKAFVQMIESRTKPGADAMGGGAYMDRGGSSMPLTYEDARNFESSLGARIDWDDPGGKMNALQKKMREAIGKDTATALKPHGLDTPYLRAKAEFTKAHGAEEAWGPFGYFGGRLAGYAAGTVAGHPLVAGYAGGQLGRSVAGSMARSVVNAGEREMLRPAAVAPKPSVDPEATRLRQTAQPARDTAVLNRVRAQHPNWSLSQQLMEAAKRNQERGQQ